MNNFRPYLSGILFSLLILLLPFSHAAAAQQPAAPANQQGQETSQQAKPIDEAQLAQLLAPIALYPDPLLMQMFVASTYPLEVVEAARFMHEHADLKDEALDEALKDKGWDMSVKSLCHFPTVLEAMNKNLEATKELGDFFLQDQKAVLDMVQKLRAKAKEKGTLKSTEEQKVVEEGNTIVIEPAKPDVIYVPSYSCSYVYGPWWYPSHPPVVWYPPPPTFTFVAGVAVGAIISHGWYHANWARGRVDININHQAWRHNPRHRRGVAYNNPEVRKRYGQVDRAVVKRNLQSRGYQPKMTPQQRQQIKQRSQQRTPQQRQQHTQQIQRRARTQTPRSSSFKASGSRSQARRSSSRGSYSRSHSRSRGGGARRVGGRRR